MKSESLVRYLVPDRTKKKKKKQGVNQNMRMRTYVRFFNVFLSRTVDNIESWVCLPSVTVVFARLVLGNSWPIQRYAAFEFRSIYTSRNCIPSYQI